MSTKAPIDSLTGLRGIAALAVLYAHYGQWCAPYQASTNPPVLNAIFDTDQVGMTLFFTLSGFVITYNYLDFGWNIAPLKALGKFLFLRFSRLYPALIVFFVFTALRFPPHLSDGSTATWWIAHLLSAQTWIPLRHDGVLPINGTFFVSWSISTEFMFYIAFGLALLIWSTLARNRIFRTALIIAFVAYLGFLMTLLFSEITFENLINHLWQPLEKLDGSQWNIWVFNLSPYFRLINFVIGCAAALLVLQCEGLLTRYRRLLRELSDASFVLVILIYLRPLLALAFPVPRLYFGQVDTVMSLCFGVIMTNGRDDNWLNRWLSGRSLVFLGTISYSLYLFHYIRPSLLYKEMPYDPHFLPFFAINLVVATAFAIVVAYGMYSLVEVPGQRALRKLLQRREPMRRAPVQAGEPLGAEGR